MILGSGKELIQSDTNCVIVLPCSAATFLSLVICRDGILKDSRLSFMATRGYPC